MKIKVRSPAVFAAMMCCIFFAPLFADDGGSFYPDMWTYGNIYVKEKNADIALKRESMFVSLDRRQIETVFEFENTTNRTVSVPCAFPVRIVMPITHELLENPDSRLLNGNERVFWQIAFGVPLNPETLVTEDRKKQNTVRQLDKKLYTIPYETYMNWLETIYTDEDKLWVWNVQKLAIFSDFSVTQNGAAVPMQTVGVETTLFEDRLVMTLHFYHRLEFKPSQFSIVTAQYSAKTEMSERKGTASWYLEYDISTGGTWKGNMESFALFIHNQSGIYELERIGVKSGSPEFEKTAIGDTFTAYAIQNYAPGADEYFKITGWSDADTGQDYRIDTNARIEEIRQDFVKNVRASSVLPGKMRIRELGLVSKDDDYPSRYEDFNMDVDESLLRSSTYSPLASFDGLYSNGWVEGAKDDGIGQWIEFTLTQDVFGPFATNGLAQQVPCMSGSSTTWLSNNRIKKMGLYKNGERIATLDFDDHFGGFPNYSMHSDGKFESNAVKNPLFLEKGTWRLVIEDIYPGDKQQEWHDTALGEVWFYPAGNMLADILAKDRKSASPVFLPHLLQTLHTHIDKVWKLTIDYYKW